MRQRVEETEYSETDIHQPQESRRRFRRQKVEETENSHEKYRDIDMEGRESRAMGDKVRRQSIWSQNYHENDETENCDVD